MRDTKGKFIKSDPTEEIAPVTDIKEEKKGLDQPASAKTLIIFFLLIWFLTIFGGDIRRQISLSVGDYIQVRYCGISNSTSEAIKKTEG